MNTRHVPGGMALLLMLALTGCNDSTPKSSSESPHDASLLTSSAWKLVDLGGTPALSDVPTTLEFPDADKIAGRGSCNRFFGSARVQGDSIHIEGVGSTKMACPDPIMAQESRYLQALENASRFEIEGSMLRLYVRGMDQPLKFVRTTR